MITPLEIQEKEFGRGLKGFKEEEVNEFLDQITLDLERLLAENDQLMMENQNAENFPLTESVERKSFDVLLPLMETADAAFLSQDAAVWQENIDWMLEQGLISETVALDEVRVNLDF